MEASHSLARPSGIATVVGEIRAERRRLIVMRASFLVVSVLYILLLVWVLPWFPVGMQSDDFTVPMATALLLAISSSLASLLFFIVWVPHFRHETVPEFLRVLFGAQQLIRGRPQFHSRLAAECHRSRRDRRLTFSLILLRMHRSDADHDGRASSTDEESELTALLVRGLVRAHDVVTYACPDEVWVLALGANPYACESIVERLRDALTADDTPLRDPDACSIGSSSFDRDGHQPEDLLAAAYQQMVSLVTGRRAYRWLMPLRQRHQ